MTTTHVTNEKPVGRTGSSDYSNNDTRILGALSVQRKGSQGLGACK